MRAMPGIVVACAFAGVLAIACTEDEPHEVAIEDIESALIDRLCEAMFSCDCAEGRAYGSLADCQLAASSLADALPMLVDMGFEYDPACVGGLVAHVEAHGCKPSGSPSEECVPPCNVLIGRRGVGEPCQQVGSGMSDCRQGLECWGECVDPCATAQLGWSCDQLPCSDDLVCRWNSIALESTCVAAPELGEECPEGQCAGDAFCALSAPIQTANVCIAPRELGEPCMGHVWCTSGYCPAGSCAEMPSRGEPCPAQVCDTGLACRQGVCEVAAAEVCSLGLPWTWH